MGDFLNPKALGTQEKPFDVSFLKVDQAAFDLIHGIFMTRKLPEGLTLQQVKDMDIIAFGLYLDI